MLDPLDSGLEILRSDDTEIKFWEVLKGSTELRYQAKVNIHLSINHVNQQCHCQTPGK